MPESKPLMVTIIGAGIAGMSAALRLLQAGCSVTVIEKTNRVGGQFGALKHGPRYHEHAFHIFADWNQNFFDLCKDIGIRRPTDPGNGKIAFEPRPAFLILRPLGPRANKYAPKGRESKDFNLIESFFDSFKLRWLNDRDNKFHTWR